MRIGDEFNRRPGSVPSSPADLEAEALAAMRAAGLAFEGLEVNAGWRRHPKQDACWYIANAGNGRTGRPWLQVSAGDARITGGVDEATFTWKSWDSDHAPLPPGELAEIQQQLDVAAQQRREQLAKERQLAAEQATGTWATASTDVNGHPYLLDKQVRAHGLRRLSNSLLVPVADIGGRLHGLQSIRADGAKRFNTGCAVAGHFHLLGNVGKRLYLCEGYATAATVYQATGQGTAACFHCSNLKPVAEVLRQAYSDVDMVVCADNDQWTEGNPGTTKARAAAAAVGAALAVPTFSDTSTRPTDWNDLQRLQGIEEVRRQLAGAERVEQAALGVSVIRGDKLHPEPISWLWEGWLARGKVHVLAGAPGTGKTSVALALAATLTTAGRWPDGTTAGVGHVLIWSGEDDPRDTLVPRLLACGADLSRVHFVSSVTDGDGTRSFDPARDADLLRDHAALMDPKPTLLIVDPIVSAVAGDSHKNAEVRRALQPLVDLGVMLRCVVLGISHFTKGTAGRDPVERVTGSLAFGALARVVLAAAKLSEDDGGGRMLARAKSNIGLDMGGFMYDLEQTELVDYPGIFTTQVLWGQALDGTARELLGLAEVTLDPEEGSALQEAKEFLEVVLADGPVLARDVYRESREAGHSERTLKRAKTARGIIASKDGFQGKWKWALPAKGGQEIQRGPSPRVEPFVASFDEDAKGVPKGSTKNLGPLCESWPPLDENQSQLGEARPPLGSDTVESF